MGSQNCVFHFVLGHIWCFAGGSSPIWLAWTPSRASSLYRIGLLTLGLCWLKICARSCLRSQPLKFLIFLLAILLGVWLWRRNRLNDRSQGSQEKDQRKATQGHAPSLQPSPMLACKHCGVHMPEADMFKGRIGHYCSQAHCQAAADQPA